MAESKLLQEAIADAKAVRETAIANAKLALEEAFTPKLQSMLSKKIEEEADDTKDEEEMKEQTDSSGIGKGDNKLDQASGDDTEKNAETKKDTAAYGSEDPNLKVVDKLTEEDEKEEGKHDEGMHDEDDDPEEGMHEDLDLEEIIRELEEEDDDKKEGQHDEAYHEEDEKEEGKHDEMMKKEMSHEEGEDKEEGMHDEMKEADDDDSNVEINIDADGDDDDDVDIDLDEIIKSLTEEDDDKKEGDKPEEMMKKEMEKKEEELEEAYATIRSLKSTINEVNLLNAKLLFSNKLFKSHNLTEGQKMKIIETLDRANSTREVKLVYTTLAESLSAGASKKQTIKEGIASRPTKSTAPAKEVIVESNQFSSRMKKLAGLL
tara:strand:- start:856 stop:1983 length:1128 start_codon:yes stop_codon:yes gene_type:complete